MMGLPNLVRGGPIVRYPSDGPALWYVDVEKLNIVYAILARKSSSCLRMYNSSSVDIQSWTFLRPDALRPDPSLAPP